MKLGEILIQLGKITPSDFGVCARRDPPAADSAPIWLSWAYRYRPLSFALGGQMGAPSALERHFSRADPAIVALLKASLAVRYLAVRWRFRAAGSSKSWRPWPHRSTC